MKMNLENKIQVMLLLVLMFSKRCGRLALRSRPRQQGNKSSTGFYHVMIRGNERKNLFLDDQDSLYFIEILKTKIK